MSFDNCHIADYLAVVAVVAGGGSILVDIEVVVAAVVIAVIAVTGTVEVHIEVFGAAAVAEVAAVEAAELLHKSSDDGCKSHKACSPLSRVDPQPALVCELGNCWLAAAAVFVNCLATGMDSAFVVNRHNC